MRQFGLLAALAAFTLTSPLLAQEKLTDWAQFRGPKFAVSSEKVPTTWSERENFAWKTKLPGPGTSSPIVFNNRIYLTCYSGYNVPGVGRGEQENLKRHLLCLNAGGKIEWDTETKAKLPEQENIRDSHGYASSTPIADKDHVYCFYGKTGVFAFSHEGKEIWHAKDVGDRLNGWGSAASPVLHGDLVIVNASVESSSLIAFDKKTGTEKWRAKGINESWNTPILVTLKGKTELIVAIQGKILAFDPENGKQLWTCKTDIGWYMVPTMVANDGVIYCLGGRSGTVGLAVKSGGSGDVTNTHRLWTSTKGSNVTSPIFHEGHLYWMSDSSPTIFCADAKTGEVIYQENAGRFGQVYASPVLADGKIFYTSRDGQTLVVKASPKFEKLAVNDLRDRSLFHGSPAVTSGRLLLRSDKYLYCVEKK